VDSQRLRENLTIERPPPATPATRRLRVLIALTAAATVVVELVNLGYAEETGSALAVRTVWAMLRALGFLALMRAVRYGRLGSRPFGLILAVTTVFSVARLVLPRAGGLLPPGPVLAGFAVLTALCAAVVWQLYRSPAIAEHLARRPPCRHFPPGALTARIATLSYAALLLVPCLVAAGTLAGRPRLALPVAVPLVVAWFVGSVLLGLGIGWLALFLLYGKGWARGLLIALSVVLLVVQPALCWALLGPDGLVRDGGPMVVAGALGLYALIRSPSGRPASAGRK
jgi:hypothetical protein